jgi:hypothetical protein
LYWWHGFSRQTNDAKKRSHCGARMQDPKGTKLETPATKERGRTCCGPYPYLRVRIG